MSSAAVEESVVKTTVVTSNNNNTNKRRTSNSSCNPQKKFKSNRKRSKSFSTNLAKLKSFKPVLPSKFLLGGNINDPLNLNSLQDEEINKAMNAVTPKSSPIPTPPRRKAQIEVIIPPNIHDPLNLIDCADEAEYEQQMSSPMKKGRKKRVRKRRTTSELLLPPEENVQTEAQTPQEEESAKIPLATATTTTTVEEGSEKKGAPKEGAKKLKNSMDKIVSPVVPQPGAWLKRTNSRSGKNTHRPSRRQEDKEMPKFKQKNITFQYGNYNRYYGYRNPHNEMDPRLKCFSHYRYLFEGKDILDIGCNIGHITLSIARDFGAKSIVGLDIDSNLISIARKNIKHYVVSSETAPNSRKRKKSTSRFHPVQKENGGFPHNVGFQQGNYVLEDETLLLNEQPQFDVILCLSTSKWIHLNWGDAGIKLAFRRMYAQLRPGGKLLLEPQSWPSYKSKKRLTETIYKNYHAIEFFPEKFTQYLLSAEVGFAKSEVLAFPTHHSKGFQRPLHLFTKSTMFPSERSESTLHSTDTTKKVYARLTSPASFNTPTSSDEELLSTNTT